MTARPWIWPWSRRGGDAPAGTEADEIARLVKAGDAELYAGAFDRAVQAYEGCLRLDPTNARALLAISAIRHRQGDRRGARRLTERAITAHPVKGPSHHDPDKPTVIRIRCVDSGTFQLSRSKRAGGYIKRFKGGHFSTLSLMAEARINKYVVNLLGGSTAALDACPRPDLLINGLACADLGQKTLAALGVHLQAHPDLPVINRPEAVARTTRDENYRRLNALPDVRFPRTERLSLDADPREMIRRIGAAGFDLPLIVRATGKQTGVEMHLCRDSGDLLEALERFQRGGEIYVVAYADLRDDAGLYRKGRAFFIDGTVYPVAWLANDDWQIHSGDRYRIMSTNPRVQAQEQAYLREPASVIGQKAWNGLASVGRCLDLDFAGADFTVTPEGELFVFEANAAMRHNFDHAGAFPYTRPHLERVSAAFDAMVHSRITRGRYAVPATSRDARPTVAQGSPSG